MIVFLTVLYLGVLFLLVKIGVVRLTLFWKISPVLWFLLLNVFLFIPMQWGAPSGPVGVFRNVIEIVPNVSGQVVEVPVEPLQVIKEGEVLFQIDKRPFEQEVKRLEAALVDAKQQPDLLASNVKISEATVAKTMAEQDQAKKNLARSTKLYEKGVITDAEYETNVTAAAVADRTVEEAKSQLEQAKLRLAALTIDGENTAVAQAKESLARAKYDLEQTTVRAPADGVVQQLALRPGARVASIPLRAAMTFVDQTRTRIAVAIAQNQIRFVKPDQSAEIVYKYRPGLTLQAKVVGIVPVTSTGQVQTSGVIEDLSRKENRAEPYQVVLEITDQRLDAAKLPGGAVGVAAIYTDRVKATHVIRQVMLRMQAWLNYLF